MSVAQVDQAQRSCNVLSGQLPDGVAEKSATREAAGRQWGPCKGQTADLCGETAADFVNVQNQSKISGITPMES